MGDDTGGAGHTPPAEVPSPGQADGSSSDWRLFHVGDCVGDQADGRLQLAGRWRGTKRNPAGYTATTDAGEAAGEEDLPGDSRDRGGGPRGEREWC